MARKPRIHYPGAFYHVILRGNGGQDIFLISACPWNLLTDVKVTLQGEIGRLNDVSIEEKALDSPS